MVRRRKRVLDPEDTVRFHQELRVELRAIISEYWARDPVGEHPVLDKFASDDVGDVRLEGDGFNQLRKLIYDHENVSVAAWRRNKLPQMSIATSSKGDVTGNRFILERLARSRTSSLAQATHVRTVT